MTPLGHKAERRADVEKIKTSPTDPDLFSADRPIGGAKADRLNREAFAKKVASAIEGWHGRDSLVVALYGGWGSGKSSVKNMIVEALGLSAAGAHIAPLDVWQFANRDHLTGVYFDQLGIALGKGTVGTEKRRTATVRKWRQYASYLTSVGDVASLIRNALVLVPLIAGLMLLGASLDSLRGPVTLIGVVLLLLAGLLHFSSRLTTSIADVLAVRVEGGRKTLDDVKVEVTAAMRELDRPILVILDDMDRLTPDETREMVQLIKANGDFPNLVYLLLCQREIVEAHLGTSLNVNGREYLEKIVQVSFDIPLAERSKIHGLLFEGLDRLIDGSEVGERFERVRWGNVFHKGLAEYFNTPRQVNRYLSTLAFHVSVFRNEGSFEVNPIDLIALEALRLFEPEVYHLISVNRDLLTSSLRHWNGGNERQQALRTEVNAIVDCAPVARRGVVKELLTQLFPRAGSVFGGAHYGDDWNDTWFRDLRVCAPNAFDRYFHLAIPTGDISQATLDRLIAATSDRDALVSQLEELRERNVLDVALDRLEAYKERLPPENSEPLITAFFDIGDRLSNQSSGMFETSPEMHAIRILFWHLQQEADVSKRTDVLRRALAATTGLNLPVRYISLESPSDKKAAADDFTKRTVSTDVLPELEAACVSILRAAAADGRLEASSALPSMLFRWESWAGPEEPRAFSARLASTTSGALTLLRAFKSRSISHGLGDAVGREHFYIALGNVERFVSLEALTSSLAHVDEVSLSPADGQAVSLFRSALKRREEGKPDFGVGRDDE